MGTTPTTTTIPTTTTTPTTTTPTTTTTAPATANDNYEYVDGNNICETGTEHIPGLSQKVDSHVECKALCDSAPDCVAVSMLVNNFCQVFSKFCENPFDIGMHVAAHYTRLKRPQSDPATIITTTTSTTPSTIPPTTTASTDTDKSTTSEVTGDTTTTIVETHS